MNNDKQPLSALLREPEARQILEPHSPHINHSIQQGVADWIQFEETLSEIRLGLSMRTKACFINDRVIEAVRGRFADTPNIHIRTDLDLFLLDFDGRLLLRFKKLDRNGLPVNYPTKQQKRLQRQEQLPGLPPAATWVSAGYKLKPLDNTIQDILCVCCYHKQTLWSFSLLHGNLSTPVLFPEINPQAPDQAPPIVRLKPLPEREANEG